MKNSDKEMPSLTIVIPIYNEAKSLPLFLPELIIVCKANGWQIILVDDGSRDETRQILDEYEGQEPIRILRHKLNRGYGGALKTGILQVHTSHLCTMDADGQHSISDVQELFHFALDTDADLVVGDRGKLFNHDLYRSLGKWIIRLFAQILMPLPIKDLNSGFKLYRTELAKKYVTLCPNSMAFSDVITLIFINRRDLVLEHPIAIKKRSTGKSTIKTRTAFDTILEIINLAMMFNPLKIFLPFAVICFLGGIGWGLPIILVQHGISVGALLAIVTGLIFFTIGLIANQLAAIRMDKL